MQAEPKERKKPVPQKVESITAGALKLSLQERVGLVKELQISIGKEVEDLKNRAEEAAKIAGNGV